MITAIYYINLPDGTELKLTQGEAKSLQQALNQLFYTPPLSPVPYPYKRAADGGCFVAQGRNSADNFKADAASHTAL